MKLRRLRDSEIQLLQDFLYEAIFIPDGVEPPARDIIEQPELKLYYEDFGRGTADYSIVADDTNLDVKVLNGDKELTDDTIIEANDNLDITLVITKKSEENIDFDTNIKLVFNQYNK